MAKRQFLQLAHSYDPKKHSPAGWFLSEKLDGMRCFWDGGVSRGELAENVPWANVAKDHRYIDTEIRATGLWSRYGKAIQAPDWWLDKLPEGICLDGELYMGRNSFQKLTSVVKRTVNINEVGWRDVRFYVFDSPPPWQIFAKGNINLTMFKKKLDSDCYEWAINQGVWLKRMPESFELLQKKFAQLNDIFNDTVIWHHQVRLPFSGPAAREQVRDEMNHVIAVGGEGLMLRSHQSLWMPERTYDLLKVKRYLDAEGVVVGCTSGRETELGSKLLGMMGALVLRGCYDGSGEDVVFEISGFTDEERKLDVNRSVSLPRLMHQSNVDEAVEWARNNPGERCPSWIEPACFPLGSTVTFTYRELTDSGVPKEARYLR